MKALICKLVGHDYHKKNKKNLLYDEIECKICKQNFTTDGYGKVVKLTSFWKKNHLFIEKHFTKGIFS